MGLGRDAPLPPDMRTLLPLEEELVYDPLEDDEVVEDAEEEDEGGERV